MSNSVRPHRRQPIRLPRPWDSPGKNTGVGCHFLLQCMKEKSESEVAQSCLTLSNPMDRSPPGSSVHGIFQARVLEWGAIAFSATKCINPLKTQQIKNYVSEGGTFWESGTEIYVSPYATHRELEGSCCIQHRELNPVLCDNLEGWDGVEERLRREGIYVYLWLIHVDVWQKPTQHCKATILQLKINKLKKKKTYVSNLKWSEDPDTSLLQRLKSRNSQSAQLPSGYICPQKYKDYRKYLFRKKNELAFLKIKKKFKEQQMPNWYSAKGLFLFKHSKHP